LVFAFAPSVLALLGTGKGGDEYLDTYFAIGPEVMSVTRCRDLADAILSSLLGVIVPLLQNPELQNVFAGLSSLIDEWFSCGALTDAVDIGFLCDDVLPAVFQLDSRPGLQFDHGYR
jgi:hypothetical protein